ncbi:maleylacetate reductase [Nocardioides aromaticivorans]|uniref:Maleylacetate reductase n=1 Tax=Nocardioides aromaticivorans TaxID=200618 RepID=A0ABX7PSQ0_9ACTN|nr:maleylacetate reductase [Nocardioides aromaticivorans]QSR28725.1 maleylacetate reductase [Nocardioides aromaticivorans]
MSWTHDTLGQRVRMATGTAAEALAEEVDRLGARRVMVVAGPAETSLAATVTAGLPVALRHDEVVMHVPVEVAERAREAAAAAAVDAIVTVGGGSTTGLGKAVALTTGLPLLAVPTTYAGSEATDVWGLTEGAVKTTGSDLRVLPRTVVYDATLLTGLPRHLSVASGLNALAHCVDSLWAPRADPVNAALAGEGARALAAGLPAVAADPDDLRARELTIQGAYLAAVSFASAGSGLHHKICHVLGGRYDLPHAETHATVLPHVLALNAPQAPAADERLAAAFGSPTGLAGLQRLRAELDAPRALRDHGFREEDIPDAVAAVLPVVPPSNPTPVTTENLTALLRAVWEGADPS